jgi:tetratricopeptide (TPR) repeat protein
LAQSTAESSGWAIALALALVGLAAVAAYGNSFAGAFIFDDRPWIVENAGIRHLWPIWQALLPPRDPLVGGRPMISLTLAVNYALGGTHVGGYHAVNLAIHILAAWTLLGIVRRTFLLPVLRERFGSVALPLATITALLWALHPLQTESVTYVIQRTEALVGLFYLLTLYCVLRGATSNRQRLWYIAATATCLLGMATKEVMATAPAIVLLYDRTFLAGSFREAWRRRYGLYLTMAATWSVIALLLISTGFYGGSTGFAVQRFTWWSYLLTQPGVIVHYLRLAFWPAGLCLDYDWPAAQTIREIVLPGILVVGLLGLTLWAMVKRPAWGFLGAWFFVILAPTSSFVPIRDAAFEHRLYLSLAALSVGLVIGGWLVGQWLVRRGTMSPRGAGFAGGLLALAVGSALGIVTLQRNADYQSKLSIWEDTVAKQPESDRAHYNLGQALADRQRVAEAEVHFQKALEINPKCAEAHNDLGMIFAGRGQIDEAVAEYRKSLEIKPWYEVAHYNLGVALADSGRVEEAVAHYRKALEIKPDYAEAYLNLGLAAQGQGHVAEALANYRKALEIWPNFALAHNNVGTVLVEQGRLDEAIAQFNKALEIDPHLTTAHFNLGSGLAKCGRFDEAIACFQKALELQPDGADARNVLARARSQREELLKALAGRRDSLRSHPDDVALLNEMAWMLATNPNASIRNGAEAVELARRAEKLTAGQQPAVVDVLAAAYAEAGRFAEAVRTAQKALELATQQNQRALVELIKMKMALYEAGTPFREKPQPALPGPVGP